MSLLPCLDTFSVKRRASSTDDEGNSFDGWVDVGSFAGFWGSESHQGELNNAGKRQQLLDAWVSMPYADVRVGDRVIGLRGRDYDVLGVKDVRLHQRLALRTVG